MAKMSVNVPVTAIIFMVIALFSIYNGNYESAIAWGLLTNASATLEKR